MASSYLKKDSQVRLLGQEYKSHGFLSHISLIVFWESSVSSSASFIQREEHIFCTKHVLRAYIKVKIISPRISSQPVKELRF